jgi:hypothetical protein
MSLRLRTRVWIGLTLACVVIWLVAESQGDLLLSLNATGSFLTVLEVLWAVSLLGFILLVVVGAVALVWSRLRRTR